MSSVILKINEPAHQNHGLRKLLGTVNLSSLVDLLTESNLEANPRLSKTTNVTKDIEESLEKQGELFHFMSKGMLIASSDVKELERNRFRLTFADPELEGILDGGHNALAVGRFIIRTVVNAVEGEEAAENAVKPIKNWSTFKEQWDVLLPMIKDNRDKIPESLMPVEVIFPADGPGGFEFFQDHIIAISAARNNNAQLTSATMANRKGYYEEIKENLDTALVDQVEWKSNDGGRIKAPDLVSLALIPLSKLDNFKASKRVAQSPAVLFSSKGQCVEIFNDLMAEDGVVKDVKGKIVEIVDPGVKSALALMKDMPRLFDLIYEKMPEAYNGAGGRFGKINEVKRPKTSVKFKTHYYRNPCEYKYGDGYMYPLVYGLTALMKVEEGEVKWITDPDAFVKENLERVMKTFNSMISGQNFDPAKVGKANGAYNVAVNELASAYKDVLLKSLGY